MHELKAAPDYSNYVLIIGQRYSDDFQGIFQTETLPAHLDDQEFNRSLLPHFEALNRLSSVSSELIKKGYIDIIIGSLLEHYQTLPGVRHAENQHDYGGVELYRRALCRTSVARFNFICVRV